METVNDNDGNGTISRDAQGASAKRACCLSIELQDFGEGGDEDLSLLRCSYGPVVIG